MLAALSKHGSKAIREIKNLEWSVNYNATSACSSRGKGKVRACPVFHKAKNPFLERERVKMFES